MIVEMAPMRLPNVLASSAREVGLVVLLPTDAFPTGHSAMDRTIAETIPMKTRRDVLRVMTSENSVAPPPVNVYHEDGCAIRRTTVVTTRTRPIQAAVVRADPAPNLNSAATMDAVFREAESVTELSNALMD